MLNKNKKIIVAGVIVLILIVTTLVGVKILKKIQDDTIKQLGEVRKAASIDEYIETDPGLLHKENAEELQLTKKEVVSPVPTQIKLEKITMAPVGMAGGDVIYDIIGELPDNNFFRLESNNLDKLFSVNSPEEALKYIDFLMITAGRSSYDRARKTVWETPDYEKIGCKVTPEDENKTLPKDRPISQAKIADDGFEVNWVYFTPTTPAGYHKMVLQVEKNGAYIIKNSPDSPFWPCGEGFVF